MRILPTAWPRSVIDRYFLRQFTGWLVPILIGFVLLYLLIDAIERLSFLARNEASLSASVRYFLYKIPLIISQVTPVAVMISALLTLATSARHQEIVALRAGGVSLLRMGRPILVAAFVLSLAQGVWSEIVVPAATRRQQEVSYTEIRRHGRAALLATSETWYRGGQGFYHISHIDPAAQALLGVRVYPTTAEFRLDEVIWIPRARWEGGGWQLEDAVLHSRTPEGGLEARRLQEGEFRLTEPFEEFLEMRVEAEEMSYLALRQKVKGLGRKGIPPGDLAVDLELKLALPWVSFLLAALAIPIAGRVGRHISVPGTVFRGVAVGLGYWVLLSLGTALGQNGTIHAAVAAWIANGAFALLSLALYLGRE